MLAVMARRPDEHEDWQTALDQTTRTLERFLQIFLSLVAVAILLGSVFIMLKLDASSRSQGGRLYVAAGALVLLGLVDSQYGRLMRRREIGYGLSESPEYRHYRLGSLLLLLLAALVLFGFALFLP
jgi:uncharacterized membrane protein